MPLPGCPLWVLAFPARSLLLSWNCPFVTVHCWIAVCSVWLFCYRLSSLGAWLKIALLCGSPASNMPWFSFPCPPAMLCNSSALLRINCFLSLFHFNKFIVQTHFSAFHLPINLLVPCFCYASQHFITRRLIVQLYIPHFSSALSTIMLVVGRVQRVASLLQQGPEGCQVAVARGAMAVVPAHLLLPSSTCGHPPLLVHTGI